MPQLNLRIIIPALALLFVLLAGSSAQRKSLTWDEPTFITSGYTYLDKSDFRLNPEAPPLLQELVALAVWLGDFEPPNYQHPGWERRAQVEFAKDHTLRNRDRIEDMAFWARFPVWILGGCLIIVGAVLCARVGGPPSALTFALLAGLSPNLLAHGRLATTDMGCAALMFGSIWCLWRSIDDPRAGNWILLGIVAGLALLSKYTALLLCPAFLVIGVCECVSGTIQIRAASKGAGIVATTTVAVLFAGYDFAFGPGLYLDGIDAIYSRFTEGYRFYLMGAVLDRPVWYYYPVTFLLKTPEPTILLIGIAIWAAIRNPRVRRPAIYLLTPALLVIVASFFDKANLGLRRILPVYPFLFALIAIAGSQKSCRICKIVYVGLVAWAALAGALAYPHYLSYINVISGGMTNGPYLLDDSNLDWGQDLPALADWQSGNPEEKIALRYFGTVVPEIYGVRARSMTDVEVLLPEPGVYAISAHNLVHFRKVAYQTRRPEIDWLTRYEPFTRLGGSIYLYRFPQTKKALSP